MLKIITLSVTKIQNLNIFLRFVSYCLPLQGATYQGDMAQNYDK